MNSFQSKVMATLLAKGYFPKELPPVFTTKSFGENVEKIIHGWRVGGVFSVKENSSKINGNKVRGKYNYKIPAAEPEIISKPKNFRERRNINITHPIPQAILAFELAKNWKTVQKWLSRQTYSEDEIIISENYSRGVKGINFIKHHAKKHYIEAISDWLVKTDISRFYPTIYTHSIPWAAYGKEKVKKNLKTYEGSLADRLDLLVRSCNRNQTIGLPIGPETSRIIAEIISSRIDYNFTEISKKIPFYSIDRLQDDWCIGTNSLESSELVLSSISLCYREYGLDINGSKTSINHISSASQESWKSEISSFLSHSKDGLYRGRLRDFFLLCLKLQLASPGAPIISYVLSIIENRNFLDSDMPFIESFILKSAAISPLSMDRICQLILNIENSTGGLSKERLLQRFTFLLERHFDNGALFEVIWILYIIRGLKRRFYSKKISSLVENVQSSAIRLILLDMKFKNIFSSSLPIQNWERELNPEKVLNDWSWLFAYESFRNGWLRDITGIMQQPFFKVMADMNIVFYDPSKNIRKSSSIQRDRNQERRQQYVETKELIKNIRWSGFDIDLGGY